MSGLSELDRRAGVAIRIAMQDDEYGRNQLARYMEELDDAGLERLCEAVGRLSVAAEDALRERKP